MTPKIKVEFTNQELNDLLSCMSITKRLFVDRADSSHPEYKGDFLRAVARLEKKVWKVIRADKK